MQQQLISRKIVREKGVPIGYVHLWNYKGQWREKKISPKTWQLRFVASKKKTNMRGPGGLPIGSRVRWKIIAIQDAIKLADGLYITDMRGYKKMLGVKLNRKAEVGMPSVYKTKSGNLVKYVKGVKYYYNRKSKKWIKSKYQGRKKKNTRKKSSKM